MSAVPRGELGGPHTQTLMDREPIWSEMLVQQKRSSPLGGPKHHLFALPRAATFQNEFQGDWAVIGRCAAWSWEALVGPRLARSALPGP